MRNKAFSHMCCIKTFPHRLTDGVTLSVTSAMLSNLPRCLACLPSVSASSDLMLGTL